jgi:hypothetical protein
LAGFKGFLHIRTGADGRIYVRSDKTVAIQHGAVFCWIDSTESAWSKCLIANLGNFGESSVWVLHHLIPNRSDLDADLDGPSVWRRGIDATVRKFGRIAPKRKSTTVGDHSLQKVAAVITTLISLGTHNSLPPT